MIDDLKRYGDIKLAINNQQGNHDKLQKEVNELCKQKQEISLQCQNGISFICEINNKISYYKGYVDHYNKDLDNKISLSSRSLILPVLLVYDNAGKNKDKGNNDDQDKEIENKK
ncbi:MAG: hypothetical protein ABJB76_12550 [Candidatus Nitrosocosmicus sp.]